MTTGPGPGASTCTWSAPTATTRSMMTTRPTGDPMAPRRVSRPHVDLPLRRQVRLARRHFRRGEGTIDHHDLADPSPPAGRGGPGGPADERELARGGVHRRRRRRSVPAVGLPLVEPERRPL